jgi:hypothetical protein
MVAFASAWVVLVERAMVRLTATEHADRCRAEGAGMMTT